MPFDQPTRNRLARFVADARTLLTAEFTRQLQHEYGLDPTSGTVTPLDRLIHLDDTRRETARILRATLDHYLAGSSGRGVKAQQEALDRIVREQAFTVLNRLCALRMAEARGLLIESVARGYQSKGFQLYARLAGPALGETGDAYRCYLFSLFDEFAVDLAVLFDRFSPQGRLFPGATTLLHLLDVLNHPDLDSLWAEDETIGWIYQYFNSREERKAMRDASQAPRNSRELAVRNQFFTPRYVVEFLTDNTLGRIWYEMTKGETSLKESCRYLVRRPTEIFLGEGETAPEPAQPAEDLAQEELLNQPVYIPHRPLKDPREIKMLDPACGSMHFGLYAFDLFERIYEEAWEMQVSGQWSVTSEQSSDSRNQPTRAAKLNTDHRLLIADYPTKEELLLDLPRLILEHNIHGIDIDPRAVQIAGLSLWLRAQRSWQAQGVKAQDRPPIRRSHIVCAEPMPGETGMLEEFAATLQPPVLGQLVKVIFEQMKLAGEAGSLLKIEEELAGAVAEAKRQWLAGGKPEQGRLFPDDTPRQMGLELDLSGITDEAFWDRAEALVLDALQEYAEQAENGNSYQRRLFAEDAVRGFAFIESVRRRYDVVLMNPPFGEPSHSTRRGFKNSYPNAADNLAVCFLIRAYTLLCLSGVTGSISDCSWAKKYDYSGFRSQILQEENLRLLVHLGWEVLDNANVETNLLVRGGRGSLAFTLNVANSYHKDAVLATTAINNPIESFCSYLRFRKLPNNVFAFEMQDNEFEPYEDSKFVSSFFMHAVAGVKSCNSMADFRTWWEVPQAEIGEGKDWQLLHNGSPYCPFHYPTFFAVKADKGVWTQLMANGGSRPGEEFYPRAGLAYGKRTDSMYSYLKPAGQVFSQEGQAIFTISRTTIWGALALANSNVYARHANYVAGQHKYHNYLNRICLTIEKLPNDSMEAKKAHLLLRALDTANETTCLFVFPGKCREFQLAHSKEERAKEAEALLSQVHSLHSSVNATIALV